MINQNLYALPRVFVQGDRDPEGEARVAALKLGQQLKAEGWGATVGAYGGFVQVLEESGVSCICHETKIRDHGELKAKSSPAIKCQELGKMVTATLGNGVFTQALDEVSWGIRLGTWMGTSQAYCFFAGREGTLAHLIPVLTYNIKGWGKQGKPRKICLIGWDIKLVLALLVLFDQHIDNTWFKNFSLDEIDRAVKFLTQ